MPRRSKGSLIMYFDLDAFYNALRRELKLATKEIRDELFKAVKANAQSLPFKHNPVRIGPGENDVTSDLERRGAFLASIVMDYLEWTSSELMKSALYRIRDTVLKTGVYAMSVYGTQSFKDDHIGIYYEYGTGEFEVNNPFQSLGDYNPYRRGSKRIVTRSKNDVTRGIWTDLGGNIRYTDSPRGGDPDYTKPNKVAAFRRYVGDDVMAHFWFKGAVEMIRPTILVKYKEAVSKVNPVKFLYVRSHYYL